MSLTDTELAALDALDLVVELLGDIVADEGLRPQDLDDLVRHLIPVQNAIAAQSAARAHPDRLRLLGHGLPGELADAVAEPGEPAEDYRAELARAFS